MTTAICNSTPKTLELYLLQVAKDDLILYSQVRQCKAYADTLEKCLITLDYIIKEMFRRGKLIAKYRLTAQAKNYIDYNEIKGVEPLSTIIVASDEASSIFNTDGDLPEVKKLKLRVNSLLCKISQYGAAYGVFNLVALQRPTASNLNPFIKSMSTINISLRQNNAKSSEVATDDSKLAVGLAQREFVYQLENDNYGIVPWIKDQIVYENLKPHIGENPNNIFKELEEAEKAQLGDCEKVEENTDQSREYIGNVKNNTKENSDDVTTLPSFEKLDNLKELKETKEDILAKNISKIPGFVPYNPNLRVISEEEYNKGLISSVSDSIDDEKERKESVAMLEEVLEEINDEYDFSELEDIEEDTSREKI